MAILQIGMNWIDSELGTALDGNDVTWKIDGAWQGGWLKLRTKMNGIHVIARTDDCILEITNERQIKAYVNKVFK